MDPLRENSTAPLHHEDDEDDEEDEDDGRGHLLAGSAGAPSVTAAGGAGPSPLAPEQQRLMRELRHKQRCSSPPSSPASGEMQLSQQQPLQPPQEEYGPGTSLRFVDTNLFSPPLVEDIVILQLVQQNKNLKKSYL